ncbi:ATPase WRNIP1-like [Littorina saxatilis]|uniref:UBZ4-type domain-containing protein n=1 Tax=Littorina saxatilis TaxID=31220 RepID=A0AAN9BXG6_9CAEN
MECPICGQTFPQATINSHVNECLNSSDDNDRSSARQSAEADDESGGHTRVSNAPTKRKGSSNWGSLQPMKSSTQADSSVSSAPSSAPKRARKTPAAKDARRDASTVSDNKTETADHVKVTSVREQSAADQEGSKHFHTPGSLRKHTVPSLPSTKSIITPTSQPQSQPLSSKPSSSKESFAPLAERVRPKDLEDYVGQDKAVGKESMLYSLLSSDHIPSVILWGPPGCGKTTLARIIANNCRSRGNAKFVSLSAAVCGVNEVKDTIKIARNDQKMFRKKTVVFLDEIHRFNKAQQDILLPHVEDGTITLIGATTENPSFQVNSALLSRCRVIVLDKLAAESILSILQRALPYIGAAVMESESIPTAASANESEVHVDSKALEMLSNLVDGDARAALNGLQMAVESKKPNASKGSCCAEQLKTGGGPGGNVVTTEDIKEGLQRSHVLYDKTGEEHYNIISALHKSMRGSDPSASLYWLARMLEGGENPLYIARRLIRFASEDVGLADPQALTQAVAAYQGCHLIGMPECEVLLAQCAVYLTRAPKSVEIYQAYQKAKTCVRQQQGPLPSVPLHLRNASTRLMKSLGYAKGYKYNPNYDGPVDQDYFPEELVGTDFFS